MLFGERMEGDYRWRNECCGYRCCCCLCPEGFPKVKLWTSCMGGMREGMCYFKCGFPLELDTLEFLDVIERARIYTFQIMLKMNF